MTEQHLDQPSISSEEAQIPDTPMMTHYEAPWSPSVNSDSDSQQHRLCKTMFDAFGEGNTEKAQIYARVLLFQGTLLFRVYAHLVSSTHTLPCKSFSEQSRLHDAQGLSRQRMIH